MKLSTKEMEHLIYSYLWKQGTYLCFEVMMPDPRGRYMFNKERVDLLSYDTQNNWRFYELKLTKSDFHSSSKVTFYGNYNYYVMPRELYNQVKDEIPDHVGVYCINTNKGGRHYVSGCTKRAKRQDLQIDRDLLMFSFMQALSRENQKYRKILAKEFREKQNALLKQEEKEGLDELWQ